MAIALLVRVAPAHAGEAERTQAELAFQQAIEKLGRGDAAAACPLLEESDRLDPQPGTEYELGKCYEAVGRHASAWSRLRAVAEKLDARGERGKADKVRQHLASAIEPKLSRVTIVVPAAVSLVPGLVVERDGIMLGRPMWGTALPVDPGGHHLRVIAPGKRAWASSFEVTAPGAAITITVPDLLDEPGAAKALAPPSPAAPPPIAPPSLLDSTPRRVALVVGALGVAGLAVGAGFGVAAIGKGSAWRDAVAGGCDAARDCASIDVVQSIRQIERDRSTFATASTIAFIAGGVAAAGGLTLWLAAPSAGPRSGALSIAPWASAESAGITAQGAF